jgi:hypothetical protein
MGATNSASYKGNADVTFARMRKVSPFYQAARLESLRKFQAYSGTAIKKGPGDVLVYAHTGTPPWALQVCLGFAEVEVRPGS